METILARALMSDEEWAFHERFIMAADTPKVRKRGLSHRGAIGSSPMAKATGFRPFERWLHDQDPPPRQRRGPAHEA
jgi:hypothetical protein